MSLSSSPPLSDAVHAVREASPLRSRAPSRFHELDGIRGVAAFIVLLFHFGPEAFGLVLPELRDPWLFPLINGQRAVAIFFVLSGDALASGSVIDGQMMGVVRLALRRYVRLTLPIAISCVTVFALMKGGFVFNRLAGECVYNPGWLGAFLNFEPTVRTLGSYVFGDVYSMVPVPYAYNVFLWTMSIELMGSGLVFLICFLMPNLRRPLLLTSLLACAMLYMDSFYGLFVAGMVFSQLRARGVIARLRSSPIAFVLTLLCPIAVYLFDVKVVVPPEYYFRVQRVAACLCVFALYACAPYAWLFRTAVARWLGTLSFPLYLAQLPVLVSIESWLVVHFYRYGIVGSRGNLYVCIALGCAAAVALAIVFRELERALLPRLERQVLRLLK